MRRIRTDLNIIFIAIVTLVLTLSGTVSYIRTKHDIEQDLNNTSRSLDARLQSVLPNVLWNFDDQQLGLILDAEMRSVDIASIEVSNTEALLAGRTRHNGTLQKVTQASDDKGPDTHSTVITYQQNQDTHPLGTVKITMSRERSNALLRKIILEKIIEIAILDFLVILALSSTLQRIVIRPLAQLGKSLNQAAIFDSTQEPLPNNPYQEFLDVTNGFKKIVDRLKMDLDIRSHAEAQMRKAKEAAETAFIQLKDAQQSLIQSEKMASLGSLVAGIAHEINTPVGIILTSASVLHDDSVAFSEKIDAGTMKKSDVIAYSQTAEQSSTLIMSNAVRAAELIQSFKRIAVDQTSEARRDFELGQYLQEVIASIRPSLRHNHIAINIICPDAIPLEGYPGAISQIITNLINNAALHAFNPSELSADFGEKEVNITAESYFNTVSLHVSDNGIGIDEAVLGKIFDPFYTTKRANGGSGLGLNIVFNLVTKTLGGHIHVKSTLGKGTTFTMTFPVTAP